MRLPIQLRTPLGPSRIAMLAIGALAMLATAILLVLPAPAWLSVLAAIGLGGWAHLAWKTHATRSTRSAVIELMLSTDGVVVVRRRDGRMIAGYVQQRSFVHPWLSSIAWKPDGATRSRHLLVLPDMLDRDVYRRVRVLLRYGRMEVDAGAPASHA